MKHRDLVKSARAVCSKHSAHGCIVIVLTDEDVIAESWSPSGREQRVTEALMAGAVEIIVKALSAASDADKSTKGKNARLTVTK